MMKLNLKQQRYMDLHCCFIYGVIFFARSFVYTFNMGGKQKKRWILFLFSNLHVSACFYFGWWVTLTHPRTLHHHKWSVFYFIKEIIFKKLIKIEINLCSILFFRSPQLVNLIARNAPNYAKLRKAIRKAILNFDRQATI